MSISQIESKIKSLQAEIARLNKQNTTEAGKEADDDTGDGDDDIL